MPGLSYKSYLVDMVPKFGWRVVSSIGGHDRTPELVPV
jgi:hypothetical protein